MITSRGLYYGQIVLNLLCVNSSVWSVTPESQLSRQIQLRASELGARVFRNNIGFCRCRGRKIRYGVCNPGGSDRIGWTKDGRFLAIEVKVDTPLTESQSAFLAAVRKAGGVAIVARSIDDITVDTLR